MKNCPDCNRVLEPATLNPKHQWCSVCAMEFDEKGKKCESHLAPPSAIEIPLAIEQSKIEPGATIKPPVGLPRQLPAKLDGPRFRVQVGQVSFEAPDNLTLDIAGTKVVITAL